MQGIRCVQHDDELSLREGIIVVGGFSMLPAKLHERVPGTWPAF